MSDQLEKYTIEEAITDAELSIRHLQLLHQAFSTSNSSKFPAMTYEGIKSDLTMIRLSLKEKSSG